MYVSISYDITSTKARNKVVKLLESYGFRVQKSVFEVQLNKRQYRIFKKELSNILKWAKKNYPKDHVNVDSIKFYILSKEWEWNLDWRIDGLGDWFERVYFEDFLVM